MNTHDRMYLYIPEDCTSDVEELARKLQLPAYIIYQTDGEGTALLGPDKSRQVTVHSWPERMPYIFMASHKTLKPWEVAEFLSDRYEESYLAIQLKTPFGVLGKEEDAEELAYFLKLKEE